MSRHLSPEPEFSNGASHVEVEVSAPDDNITPKTSKKNPYEITEEDLFRIKELRNQTVGSELNELSNVSVADSKSNFDEHVPDVDSEWKSENGDKDANAQDIDDEQYDENYEEVFYKNFQFFLSIFL